MSVTVKSLGSSRAPLAGWFLLLEVGGWSSVPSSSTVTVIVALVWLGAKLITPVELM